MLLLNSSGEMVSGVLLVAAGAGQTCDKHALTDFYGWMIQAMLAGLAFTCLIGNLFWVWVDKIMHNELYSSQPNASLNQNTCVAPGRPGGMTPRSKASERWSSTWSTCTWLLCFKVIRALGKLLQELTLAFVSIAVLIRFTFNNSNQVHHQLSARLNDRPVHSVYRHPGVPVSGRHPTLASHSFRRIQYVLHIKSKIQIYQVKL